MAASLRLAVGGGANAPEEVSSSGYRNLRYALVQLIASRRRTS
jgi:hypothetical protein